MDAKNRVLEGRIDQWSQNPFTSMRSRIRISIKSGKLDPDTLCTAIYFQHNPGIKMFASYIVSPGEFPIKNCLDSHHIFAAALRVWAECTEDNLLAVRKPQ